MADQPATTDTSLTDKSHEKTIKRTFLMPAVIYLLVFSIFPLFWSLGISFTDYGRGGGGATQNVSATGEPDEGFLGLGFHVTARNYRRMLSDQRLHNAAGNTLTFVFAGVIFQYIMGFLLALLLNQDFRGRSLARVIFLMPMMMTPVAVAYTGRMMVDTRISPQAHLQRVLNSILGTEFAIPWLGDGLWANVAIVLIDSWQWIPFMTLLLLAGMQGIPDDIYEAARVDGASSWQLLLHITFPLLLPISITAILIRGLEIFKIFDIIAITTGGGPGSATESLTMYIFDTALTFGNYGYAAAISFALLLLVIVFSTVFLGLSRRTVARNGQ
jgi:multiple sugar transport system permease protein